MAVVYDTYVKDIHVYNHMCTENSYMTTYEEGPTLYFVKPVSKGDFIHMCDQLTKIFDHELICKPDMISDGGIRLVLPDHVKKRRFEYKSMRFGLDDWPYIHDINEWENNHDVLFNSGTTIYTCLKAANAPSWTGKEINLFLHVLKHFGICLK